MESHATELPGPRQLIAPLAARRGEVVALRRAAAALGALLVIVVVAGAGSFLALGAVPHGGFDPPGVVDHLGGLRDALAAPFARWDSVWYLTIARDGYTGDLTPAFFPLYPLLVAGVGSLGPGLLAGGVLVSVTAMLVAMRLLWRLTELELGAADRDAADLAVLAAALAPMAFFFIAVYSESLYLALTLGTFLAARQGRWARAGLLGALAAATRSSGLLLMLALVLIWLEQRDPRSRWARWPTSRAVGTAATGARRRPGPPPGAAPRRRDLAWIAVVPLGLLAFLGWLDVAGLDPTAPLSSQQAWLRHFSGPFGGVLDGARAALGGVRQLLSGQTRTVYYRLAGGDPMIAAWHNVMLFGFLLLSVPLLVGALRRLPLAYGVYALAAVCVALSYPIASEPLTSLPRYLVVLFPLPMALALWLARHPRLRLPLLGASAVSLAGFSELFATWHWIA
jgi:hypothetical protein